MTNPNLNLTYPVYVVFDQTSFYIIPKDEFNPEDEEVWGTFLYMEDAQSYCDDMNEESQS